MLPVYCILTCCCTYIGSVYIFLAVATLIGTPTSGALLKATDEKHFQALIIFTGVLLAVGTVALVGAVAVGNDGLRERMGLRSPSRGAERPEN